MQEDPSLALALGFIGLVNEITTELDTIINMAGAMISLEPETLRESIAQLRRTPGLPFMLGDEKHAIALL